MGFNPNLGKRGSKGPLAHSYACSSYVWHSIKLKLLDISDQHVLHMCIKFHVPKLNTHCDIVILWKPLFDFSYEFLNFPLISPARWLESVNTTMAEKRKKGDGSATFWKLRAGWNCIVWWNLSFTCITNRWNITFLQ